MKKSVCALLVSVLLGCVGDPSPAGAFGEEPPTVSGTFTANGEAIELTHVYAYAEEKGFYDESDPSWFVMFIAGPVEPEDLGGFFFDFASVRLNFTLTSEFDEEPTLRVYSQNLVLDPDAGGNISGGTYPEFELEVGPDRLTGHVYLPEAQEFFDDTFQYDLTFDVPLSEVD